MAQIIRPVGYSGSYQELTVTASIAGSVTAYLWGAGGGGGGGPDGGGSSGFGGGGGFSQVIFGVSPGDTIGIAVGGAGIKGTVGGGVGGGSGGASYITGLNWSTLNLLTQPDVVRSTNGVYGSFLNQYGVWNTNISSSSFERSETVYFPYTGSYTFVGICDDQGAIGLDGNVVATCPTWEVDPSSTSVYVTQGYHLITIYGYNWGGPGSIAVRIYSDFTSYNGGNGGASGGSGGSGSGGGGGGATLLFHNGNIIGVAGGGGGGGGAGQYNYNPSQCDAPGAGIISGSYKSGQNGQNFSGDGGGGGGAGGGDNGGQGGATRGHETTGWAGSYGGSTSNSFIKLDPIGTQPGGALNAYRDKTTGVGGQNAVPGVRGPTSGGPGQATFLFDQHKLSIKDSGTWSNINQMYVKQSGVWSEIKKAWIKQNGSWTPIYGSNDNAPTFVPVAGKFGASYRSY